MRKSILSPDHETASSNTVDPLSDGPWLNLQEIARVELSSEDEKHPFENALQQGIGDGWRAGSSGPQFIRFHFDQPQTIRRIRLQFREEQVERSQEFTLFVTSGGHARKGVIRQQWNFTPGHAPIEVEDYAVELAAVSALELEIDPGRHNKQAIATLQSIAMSA